MNRAAILVQRLVEDDPPKPGFYAKDVINDLTPTQVIKLGGADFVHTPGLIKIAQHEYRCGAKGRKWAKKLLSTWQLAPEIVNKILGDPRTTVEADGHNASVTVHNYAQPTRTD